MKRYADQCALTLFFIIIAALPAGAAEQTIDLRRESAECINEIGKVFSLLATENVDHLGTILNVGQQNTIGLTVSLRFEGDPTDHDLAERHPYWTVDQWEEQPNESFLVTSWRFTADSAKRGIYLRRDGSLEIIQIAEPVPMSKEAHAMSALAWNVLCQTYLSYGSPP